MKTIVIATTVALSFGLFAAGNAGAQQSSATDTASASATIVSAIAISKTADLNFGQVVAGASLGTVVMTTAGARSSTGGTTLANSTGISAASFAVTGNGSDTYSITLPSSISLSDGASNTMSVDTFVSNPSGTGTLSSGAQTLNVGAKLHVGASQVAGSYSNTFDVTVAYN